MKYVMTVDARVRNIIDNENAEYYASLTEGQRLERLAEMRRDITGWLTAETSGDVEVDVNIRVDEVNE